MKSFGTPLKVEKATQSKIEHVDFQSLSFGKVFTDHMMISTYKNGEWSIPEVKPYQNLSLAPSARVFHYGQEVFEGMKAYKDDAGKVWLFRPMDNFNRINISSERLAMPAFREDYFCDGLSKLLELDQEWIKSGDGNSLYIRPFVIATEEGVAASPANEYMFIIICSPVQSYYAGEVRVKIAEKFSRAAQGGTGYAKAGGNYGGSFYPALQAQKEGFQQIVWTDANTHEYIEEAGTMNIFIRIGDKLLTGPTSESILDGITRKSLIQIAEDKGIDFEVRPIKVSEVIEAHKAGELKEMFGAGTAAVVSPIKGFGYKGEKYELIEIENKYSDLFKKIITDIQQNKSEDPYGWRVAAF
ncbi:MAG: branched-chain amino acid aminotransferase [Flavobacteriaceae bacterium]|jgi:branched-chain amino acid aminotransferase|nr:branched-chain amino acid aminotransferase [Flavobacteriaceae bacterium]NVJ72497.1 branched-chain amino acid aminotransferase [Flavobacteriaceae bacterium]